MKSDLKKLGLASIVVVIVVFIYHGWFSSGIIARGDWRALSSARTLDFLGPPSVWDEAQAGGFSILYTGIDSARLPLFNLQANLHKNFGLGFEWTERIIWFFPFLIFSTLSIYLLSKRLFKNTLVSFFATIYFVSNNFIIFRLHGAQIDLAMTYALAPLSIYFFVRGVEEKRLIFAILNGLVLSAAVYHDLRIAILIVLIQAAYGLYYSLLLAPDKLKNLRVCVKNLAASGVLVLSFNIFWLLPLAIGFRSSLLPTSDLLMSNMGRSLSRTDFINALALSIGANSKWNRFIYLDGQIVTAALFPILLIIYGASFLAKPRKDYLFWFLASIVLAFFAKGLNPPLSSINALFYNYVPLSAMYREPSKLLMVGGTAISLCFGLGCAGILSRIKRSEWRTSALLGLAFLPILVILPALFGSKSLRSTEGGSSFKPFVAPSYFEFERWLNQQEAGYKSVFLPGGPGYNFFSRQFPIYEPVTSSQTKSSFGSYFGYRFGAVDGLRSPDDRVLPAMLRLLNVKYLFLAPPDDTIWPWYAKGARSLFRDMLLGIDEFKKTENEDIFVLENPVPRFYLSRQLVHIDGDFEEVLGELLDSQVDLQALTLVDGKTADSISSKDIVTPTPSDTLPEVEVEKLGNARYKIKISDPPEGKFYLNFQDGYDSNWQINGTVQSSLSAAGTNYFELANESGSSSLELVLEHRLQKYLDVGWKITKTSWLVVFLILICAKLKKLKN